MLSERMSSADLTEFMTLENSSRILVKSLRFFSWLDHITFKSSNTSECIFTVSEDGDECWRWMVDKVVGGGGDDDAGDGGKDVVGMTML